MPLELKKATPVRLREVSLDEKWLQDRVAEDPSLLGLGDLHVITREKLQQSGGRIDFLMYDPEAEIRYEVEIMLGTLDESHIIRTIEYWDLERQRVPTLEHRAVIVAEEITSRFFNVIRLLNRAVPIIALQLNAFRFEEAIVLHFTKVLDIYESFEDEEDGTDQADRHYWEKRASQESLAIVDDVISMVRASSDGPRITYNKGHIAVGTTGYNFLWFHPRRTASHCHITMRPGHDQLEPIIKRLEDAGISAGYHRRHSVKMKLTTKELRDYRDLVQDVVAQSEQWSRNRGSVA
jgi:hypothetical protein